MSHSRSRSPETPARADDLLGQGSASTQIPDDSETSEFHPRKVMDTIPGLVWSAFPDGGVEFCNQTWLDYTGLSLDKVRGGELAEPVHAQDESDFREKWRAALAQGAAFEAEARMRRADGSYRWFLIRAVPLRDAEGGIIRWYGTNADIEDLKRAQEEVQKQTSRLDELFEQAPEAVAVLSTDDRIVRVNKEFTRMFGYEPDEVLERPINDLIVPETLVESSREHTRQLKQGGRVEVETVRRRKDGSEVDVSLLAVPVTTTAGEQVVNYAIYRDITERKRSEERLRESEARFQTMADTAPVMIWMTGTDGLCNYFNKPWLEFTARTMEQEVGTGWVQGVHPDDVQGCFDTFLPAFHARNPFRMEYRLRRADGEYRWVLESGIPRYTEAGEFAGYIGSNIDITAIKRAEEERRAHLWFLESMDKVNRAIQGTYDLERMTSDVLDEVFSIFNSDRAWLVYPCDPKALSWKVPMEHARPEFPGAFTLGGDLPVSADVAEVFQTVRASNTPVRFGPGSKHQLPSETAARFSIQSMIGMAIYPKGDKPYMFGLHQCSSARVWSADEERLFQEIGRRLEDALTSVLMFRSLGESERKLEEAQRLAHVGYWARDLDTDLITWSDETYRIFAVPKEERLLTFNRVEELTHSEDRPMVQEQVSAALRGGPRYDTEFRVVRPAGEVRIVHVQADVTWDESGRPRRMFGTVQDITERKLAEAERERLGQRLRQAEKMEAVGRLAGGIAHDFNNVLAGILAYGEMLFEETAGGSPLKRYAQNVLTAATRGRELVEQILAYSRSQRGKRVPVDIARVVAETLELVRGSLPSNIHLDASAPPLPFVVVGDATQLHQVMMNLCSNAIQAMSGGGSLRVALEVVDVSTERALSHGTLRPGRYVRLAVADSGPGMDEATLSRIFEPFFTTKEIGRGTGLGLSLVYAIVTDSEGAIDVKSAPGQGSTFAIYLPLTQAALAAAIDEAGPLPRGNSERVLLVDDEAQVLAVTAEVLSRLGYEPAPFSDSQAALAAFEAAPARFDVVVTDEVMPGISGTELASVVRRRRPDLPIVLLSGYSGPILTQQALDAGINELLAKPLQSREIATALARVLHRAA